MGSILLIFLLLIGWKHQTTHVYRDFKPKKTKRQVCKHIYPTFGLGEGDL